MHIPVTELEVSIHAPARGATLGTKIDNEADGEFQSTLPRGERLIRFRVGLASVVVSIHAPARGATTKPERFMVAAYPFQSTLPRGERLLALCDILPA